MAIFKQKRGFSDDLERCSINPCQRLPPRYWSNQQFVPLHPCEALGFPLLNTAPSLCPILYRIARDQGISVFITFSREENVKSIYILDSIYLFQISEDSGWGNWVNFSMAPIAYSKRTSFINQYRIWVLMRKYRILVLMR
jgi:hypothetical protein